MVTGIGVDRAEKKLRSVIAAQEMRTYFLNHIYFYELAPEGHREGRYNPLFQY